MSRSCILVTGGAGFIGSHLVESLLASGSCEVYCIDSFDDFYDPGLKLQNLSAICENPNFHLVQLDIAFVTPGQLCARFEKLQFDAIIHLAARAGVRPSIEKAELYYEVNLKGTLHLLEYARMAGIPRFIFASSSSVYGNNPNLPWMESDLLHKPISPYAATKLAAEEMVQVYGDLYHFQYAMLRLFTVYGPRQRPDLAIHRFYELIKNNQPVTLFGDGNTRRDYTYIDDIVAGILATLQYQGNDNLLLNLGNHQQVTLMEMVHTLEDCMDTRAIINWQPEQPGDVEQTYADISRAAALIGYHPNTIFKEGIRRFVEWKRDCEMKIVAGKYFVYAET